ncbi:RNA polymerase sigma factor [Paludisphaera mucosa]|uniref:Sigma-70 family RNA polymerase sigma factor n=1 Tax=Paludisphaera mucosa TaxID=3030827 RepID=A0ABT6FKG4_9BACT|nr:sigma-70 family RNA polymerase sigma factor [Paludisphaera mucosa]MDG3008071.1 sigma-70 family RNA polymerase sigma factor [Paludisphaera mucosa]
MSDESLDRWIERLNEGDPEAVERVFLAYEPYMRIVVRRRLSRGLRPKVDSGDIVQSVFVDFVAGVRNGGWRFAGRGQLLAFLRRIAARRIADRCRKHRHALGREQSLADTEPRDHPQSPLPRPSQEAQGREFWERILQACPPSHREIVRLRRDGLRLAEIATRSGLHEGSVRRILYDLARRLSVARRTVASGEVD